MSLLLGIDIGTSSVKASLLNSQTGDCVASSPVSLEEIPRYIEQPGWCEQDPKDWWDALVAALQSFNKEHLAEVTAIGIAYQMHGLVLLDENLEPTRRSIIWSDGRATQSGRDLFAEVGPSLLEHTLNHPGNFTAAKLRWVKDNDPAAFARARFAVLPGDYIAAKLTGIAATTSTGLSEMAGWDFEEGEVSQVLFDNATGGKSLLPDLVPIFGIQGHVSPTTSELTGLPSGTPVTYRAGDQPNNALSLNVLNPGEVAAVAGTSGVLYGVTDLAKLDPLERVNTFLHVNSTQESLRLGVLLCVNGCGALYSWVRRLLGLSNFGELNELAASAPIGSNGLFALPYGNGAERSLGNQYLGAGFSHIDLNQHTRADIARAALESIVFALRFGAEAMNEMGMTPHLIRAGESSMFQSPGFCQMVADIMNCEIELLNTDGSLGAARGAGFGSGAFPTLPEAFMGLNAVAIYSPIMQNSQEYESVYARWRETLKLQLNR